MSFPTATSTRYQEKQKKRICIVKDENKTMQFSREIDWPSDSGKSFELTYNNYRATITQCLIRAL